MTAPPPARTLDFGASATASLLVKMAITYGMSERRDQMITYSLFEKLMGNEMPQDRQRQQLARDRRGEQTSTLGTCSHSPGATSLPPKVRGRSRSQLCGFKNERRASLR